MSSYLTSISTNRAWIWYLFSLLHSRAVISASNSHTYSLCQWGVTTDIWPCLRINSEALSLCISSGDRYLINTKECYILLQRWILVGGTNAFLQVENSNAMHYKKINHLVIMVFFGFKPVYWIPLVSSNNKINRLLYWKGKYHVWDRIEILWPR